MLKNIKRVIKVIKNEIISIKKEKEIETVKRIQKDKTIEELNSYIKYLKEQIEIAKKNCSKIYYYEYMIRFLRSNTNIINKHDFYMFIMNIYGFYYNKNNKTWTCPSGDASHQDFYDINYKELKNYDGHYVLSLAKDYWNECLKN